MTIAGGVSCDVDQREEPTDVDKPATPTPARGLTVRWNKEFGPGRIFKESLESLGFIVREGHNLPQDASPGLIWIDFGSGSPWKDQNS